MVEALKGANRTVPQYLKALANTEHNMVLRATNCYR